MNFKKLLFIFVLVMMSNPLLASRKTILKKNRAIYTLQKEQARGSRFCEPNFI